MKNNKLTNLIAYWLPALIWAGIIFYLSNQPGLRVGFSTPNEILVRKAAHAIEFGVLAWLIWRLAHYGFEMKTKKAVLFAAVFAILFAVSDEAHQMFVIDRAGKSADVVVDSLGVLLALQIVVPLYVRKFKVWMAMSFAALTIALVALVGNMIVEANEIMAQREAEQALQLQAAREMGHRKQKEEKEEQVEILAEKEEPAAEEVVSQSNESVLPNSVFIEVPFTSQAPFGVWDHIHEESCEEASLIMVKYFLDGKKLTPQIVENEIINLKEHQIGKYGRFEDSDMKELVEISQDYYGLQSLKVVYDFSMEDLKIELAKKSPIIVPTAGQELGNPFFTQPGPLYHNLVLVGYEGDVIITNDPGTKRGESFKYDIDVLFGAIHDFPGKKENIKQGRKAMIVVR